MQSRQEQRAEQRRFSVWLGVAAAAHVAVIVGAVLLQLYVVRTHPPLKVINVSLVSMPGRPGPAGGPKRLPAQPTPTSEPQASKAELPAIKKLPEPPQKLPEPPTVKKIPEKPSVPDKVLAKPQPETASKKPAVSDERKKLQAALKNLKTKADSGPTNLSSTLAKLQKKVASEGVGTASSGSGSGAGGGRYGSGGGAFDPYKAELAGIIQENWSFSTQMLRSASGMEVYVSLYIMPDGSVRYSYDRKSTSAYLNGSVERAIEQSIPAFPPLPKEYGSKIYRINFMFTPTGIGQ